MAKNLQDIAVGTMPGRAELARDVQLKDAKASAAEVMDMRYRLVVSKDRNEAEQLIEQYPKAASANRAEWAAAHDNAMNSGHAALQEETREGLCQAEMDLYQLPSLNELGYLIWKDLR